LPPESTFPLEDYSFLRIFATLVPMSIPFYVPNILAISIESLLSLSIENGSAPLIKSYLIVLDESPISYYFTAM